VRVVAAPSLLSGATRQKAGNDEPDLGGEGAIPFAHVISRPAKVVRAALHRADTVQRFVLVPDVGRDKLVAAGVALIEAHNPRPRDRNWRSTTVRHSSPARRHRAQSSAIVSMVRAKRAPSCGAEFPACFAAVILTHRLVVKPVRLLRHAGFQRRAFGRRLGRNSSKIC